MTKMVLHIITFFLKLMEKISDEKKNPFRCRQKVRTAVKSGDVPATTLKLERLLFKYRDIRRKSARKD